MATTVNGTKYSRFSDYPKIYETDFFTYVATSTDTAYTLTLTAGITIKNDYGTTGNITATSVRIDGTGQTYKSGTLSAFSVAKNSSVTKTAISSFSWSWTKTHSAQSVTITSYATGHTGTKASKTFTIPAKTSYAVTYDPNGGTGQPAPDKKWYGETLTLTTSKPTKTGYTFKGWATSKANAGINSTVTTYAGNAPATFYATWELNYSKPSITNVSIERCDANGNDDDEGGYAKVDFDWSVFVSNLARYYGGNTYPYANNTIYEAHVTVGSITKTFTASDTQPIIVGNGSFSTDDQYDVEISITDTQEIATARTTTVTGVLAKSFFPIDFNSDASAMGILMPAPDNKEGVFLGKDLFLPLDTTASSGTDHDIYTALVALGWDSDVIV